MSSTITPLFVAFAVVVGVVAPTLGAYIGHFTQLTQPQLSVDGIIGRVKIAGVLVGIGAISTLALIVIPSIAGSLLGWWGTIPTIAIIFGGVGVHETFSKALTNAMKATQIADDEEIDEADGNTAGNVYTLAAER